MTYRLRVRHYDKRWPSCVWRYLAAVPLLGWKLKWAWHYLVVRYYVAYWIDGERV